MSKKVLGPRHNFVPPTEDTVADYAAGLNLANPRDIARRFIECYAPEWRDTFNRPIRNWKMKFRQVWAKRQQRATPKSATPVKVEDWTL